MPTARCAIFSLSLIVLLSLAVRNSSADPISPDKQWEYRCRDGIWSSIAKTDSGKMIVDLSNEVEVPYCQSAEVIWAPDSKHFAFNYTPPHAPHFTYQTTTFFELRGDKCVPLSPIVDEASQTSQLIQLAKGHLPKNLRSKHGDLLHDALKVRSWVDPNTAIVYAYSLWQGKGSRDQGAALLFTLKLDVKGKWQVVKTESVPVNGD